MLLLSHSRFSVSNVKSSIITSPLNSHAIAATSKKEAQQFNIDRVAEVILVSLDGKKIETTFYVTEGTEIDESTFDSLGKGYKLKELEIRKIGPDGFDIQELIKSNKSALSADTEDGVIKPLWVETAFDVGNFMMSLADFRAEPSVWNGFKVVFDGASVVFPGVPAISGVERMIKASKTLKQSLQIGVKSFRDLKKDSVPSGWHRHHIFEKRFADRLGTTENDLFAIAIPKDYHNIITQALRKEIPYGANYRDYSRSEIIQAHIDVYRDLWQEYDDEVYEFLYKFAREKQHSIR